MKTNYFRSVMVLVIMALCTLALGQTTARKNIDDQHLLWFRYFNKLTLSERWQINTQFEKRSFVDPWKHHQLVSRTQLIYKVNNTVSVSQGFTYFRQSPQDPNSESDFVVPEYRPHQEVILKNDPSKKLKLSHRYKLEERFFQNSDLKQEKLLSGHTLIFRARYLIQIQYPLVNLAENKPLKLIVSNELMANFGKEIVYNAFDQNRFTIGLAYDFNKNIGIEIDYVNWFQQRANGKDYYNRNIGRFTFYHYIDLSSKKEEKPANTEAK